MQCEQTSASPVRKRRRHRHVGRLHTARRANQLYTCPTGTTLSANRCYGASITTSQVANRTLTFLYGPEHQRIKQHTQLDNTAPSSMSAGSVYYLNGENNNLAYERDDKTSKLIADAGRRSLT